MSESYFNDLNEVTLTGRLVGDAEKIEKKTKEGATFSYVKVVIATNREWSTKDGEKHSATDFNTIYFNGSDMAMAARLCTGSRIHIKGRLKKRDYEADGVKHLAVDIVAKNLRILDWVKPGERKKQDNQQDETANQTK